jgi:hypothetical protein
MSEILSNIVLQQIDAVFQPTVNDISFTPEDIQLRIFTAAAPIAGGANTQVQYNQDGVLGGSSAFTFNNTSNTVTIANLVTTNSNLGNVANVKIAGGSNGQILITDGAGNLSFTNSSANANYANFAGNVVNSAQPNITSVGTLTGLNVSGTSNLGPVSNVIVTGGTNGYVLQTDGAGNLTWVAQGGAGNGNPGGSNTQIQFNDAGLFGGVSGFTFDKVSGNTAIPGALAVTGNVSGGNIAGSTVTAVNITANTGVFTGNGAALTNLTGANVTGTVANAAYAIDANNSAYASTLTTAAQPNVTSLGNLISLNVLGTTSVFETIENVALIGAQAGTYNYNLLDGAIQYSTANAAANVNLNFRGNSTTTANSIIANGKSITATYLLTNGTNAYQVGNISIDGTTSTVRWVGGAAPTRYSNTIQSYTFTIVKTATTPTYTVLGSMTRYA